MIAKIEDIFEQYDISRLNGFLPDEAPLQRLSQRCYQPWELVMDRLPGLIKDHSIRVAVDNMPILDTSELGDESNWRRAYSVLSFMTHGYIWGGLQPAQILPPSICVPYLKVADHFGLPSTATYAALNLWNWAPQFTEADISAPENVRMLHTFTGTKDEEWFYAISVSIEAMGAKIVETILECFEAVESEQSSIVVRLLQGIGDNITRLGTILDRMHELCNPQVFYHRIRPYLAGSKGMETAGLSRGVFYDEGNGQGSWRTYSGGSNAQSSLIQLLDIMLGIEHYATGHSPSESTKKTANRKHGYIEEMRRYMPQQHNRFLLHATQVANIRPYATRCNADSDVQKAYSDAVNSLRIFRDKHISIVARYIIAPSRQSMPVPVPETASINIASASTAQAQLCGTGGTELMPFLKQTRDETLQAGRITNDGKNLN